MNYRVGDKVRIIGNYRKGEIGEIKSINCDSIDIWLVEDLRWGRSNPMSWRNFRKDQLEPLERSIPMSKYQDLKERIEGITGGMSIKEVDDIGMEIFPDKGKSTYSLSIPTWNVDCDSIKILGGYIEITNFPYTSQCSKLAALKQALMWLLDHSGLKDEKQTEIDKLKQEIQGIQERIKELEAK